MSANTHGNLILLGVTLVVLTGCALLVYKVVSGKKGNKCPDGQTFDTIRASCIPSCATGTTYYPAYAAFNNGCLQCDPTDTTNCATCSADGDCKNGGKCIMVNGPTGKGICNCVSPYTGNMCDGVCTSTGGQCLNGGTCVSGKCQCIGQWTGQFCEKAQTFTCSPNTCVFPLCIYKAGTDNNDPTCICSPHVIPDSSTGSPCGKCEDGYGPPGDCSLKYFDSTIDSNDAVLIPTPYCHTTGDTDQGDCSDYGSSADNIDYCNLDSYQDGCGAGYSRRICKVKKYYADPSFVPADFTHNYICNTLVPKCDHGTSGETCLSPKGFKALP